MAFPCLGILFNTNLSTLPFSEPYNNDIVLPCQIFMGKTGFGLAALPTHFNGFNTCNWKGLGLTIYIHNDPWTLLPQCNFTIFPTENTTLWLKPEFFEIKNMNIIPPHLSSYNIKKNISLVTTLWFGYLVIINAVGLENSLFLNISYLLVFL